VGDLSPYEWGPVPSNCHAWPWDACPDCHNVPGEYHSQDCGALDLAASPTFWSVLLRINAAFDDLIEEARCGPHDTDVSRDFLAGQTYALGRAVSAVAYIFRLFDRG
jgi:hypothetical protein